MKKIGMIFIMTCTFILFSVRLFSQNVPSQISMQELQGKVDCVSNIIFNYDIDIYVKISFIVIVVTCGAMVTLFQGVIDSKKEKLKKWLTMCLGAVITIVSSLDQVLLKYDVNITRKYRSETVLAKMDMESWLARYRDGSDNTLISSALGDIYLKVKDDYNKYLKIKMGEQLSENKTPLLLKNANAQSFDNKPDWVTASPVDNVYVYAVGMGESKDYTDALNRAVINGKIRLKTSYDEVFRNIHTRTGEDRDVINFIISNAEIAGKYSTLSNDGEMIKIYVLIRLEKRRIPDYLDVYEMKKNRTLKDKLLIKERLETHDQ